MDKKGILKFFFIFLFLLAAFSLTKPSYAIRYSLIAPSDTLTRGQTVTFTINIDTQGETITEAKIGLTYETQYLEYVNTIAGDAFPNLTTTPQEGGKLIFSATSSGFNGNTTFAQVNFKLIADAPGESQLCVLWEVPNETPSTTTTPQSLSPQPTSTSLQPTALPTSGDSQLTKKLGLAGGGFFIFSFLGYLLSKNSTKLKGKKAANGVDGDKSK